MTQLLTISETFSAFWDSVGGFLSQYWGYVTAGISIPTVIAFICRYIMFKIKSNKTISNAIQKATGAVADSSAIINKKIEDFEGRTMQKLNDFEAKFEERFEAKFTDLKNKRIEVYNSIMEGKSLVMEGQEMLADKTDEVKEIITDVGDLAKQIQEEVDKIEEPKIEEYVDENAPILKEIENVKELVNKTNNKVKKAKISQDELLI